MQDTLNHLGSQFLAFVWPMLWQSSLLIAIIFVLDLSLARKLRASVRHALWLVVLVKLLLPPTLALPTGAAWWLFPAQPPIHTPPPGNYVVTFDNDMPMPDFTPQNVPVIKPSPKLNVAGWTLLATVAVSTGLLLWVLFRWQQVTRIVRSATCAEELSRSLDDTRSLAKLRWAVRVKIVDAQMSPAVCGLFRPVILLPQVLAEKLSPDQLRAVLLHEAFHIRRKDIWINCVQALLQIIYWWHPLVWLANARIRRVREEAVDDAVMLALDGDADTYAPTLLEVAKLAFQRPLLSLGLVGIIESRSALHQRIERLLDFRAPRRAGLTLASFCGIFMFSAVALPMGQGPAPAEKETATPALVQTPPLVAAVHSHSPQVLVTAEIYQMPLKDLHNLVSDLQFRPANAAEDAWWLASPTAFSNLQSDLKNSKFSPLLRPRILTSSGYPAEFFVGIVVGNDKHGTEINCLPKVDGEQVDLAIHGEITDRPTSVTNQFTINTLLQNRGGMVVPVPNDPSNSVVFINVEILTNTSPARFQQRLVPLTKPQNGDGASEATNVPTANQAASGRVKIAAKLDKIRLHNVSYDNLPLSEVLKQLSEQSKLRDPENMGINFLIDNNPDLSSGPSAAAPAPKIDLLTGLPVAPAGDMAENAQADVGSFIIKIPSLTDVRLADVLDAIVRVSDHPLKYSIQDFAVVFSAKDMNSPELFMRTFRIDPRVFYSRLINAMPQTFDAVRTNGSGPAYIPTKNSAATPSALARAFFTSLGVNLSDPPGKSVFLNDRLGYLFVKATESDLDTIERALIALNQNEPPPQIHIKACFISVPKGTLASLANYLTTTNRNDGKPMGFLSDNDKRTILKQLGAQEGVMTLGEPEVTVLSGRQAQVRATEKVTVVTNLMWNTPNPNGRSTVIPQTNSVEVGPVLDVIPYVMADRYTINLAAIPSLTEFLGYDAQTNRSGHIYKSDKELPKVFPRFLVHQLVSTVNIWDNQTLLLTGLEEYIIRVPGRVETDDVLVFITSTLVDRTGAHIHSDSEITALPPIPVQPK